MPVCVSVCVCVCVRACISLCENESVSLSVWLCVHACVYVRVSVCACIRYACMRMRALVSVGWGECVRVVVRARACLCVCVHTAESFLSECDRSLQPREDLPKDLDYNNPAGELNPI